MILQQIECSFRNFSVLNERKTVLPVPDAKKPPSNIQHLDSLKKGANIICAFFFVKNGPLCKLHNDALFHPAAQFFQALKNETLTRGASLTTLTTILFTSNNYILLVRPNNFFSRKREIFRLFVQNLCNVPSSSMRPDSPQEVYNVWLHVCYPVFPLCTWVFFIHIVGVSVVLDFPTEW